MFETEHEHISVREKSISLFWYQAEGETNIKEKLVSAWLYNTGFVSFPGTCLDGQRDFSVVIIENILQC